MFIIKLEMLTSSTNNENIKAIINPPHSRSQNTNNKKLLWPHKEETVVTERCDRLTVLQTGSERSGICTLESSLSQEPFLIALICSSN